MQQAAANDPRVRFLGYVTGDAKHALLASADYLIIPSLWYENAPVAVIEASAYGLGVIASRIGGLPELVHEGRTGVLFPPGDASALAAVMRGLLHGDMALPALAAESRALADAHTVDRMVENYLGRYAELLGGSTARGAELDHAA
jgi:glycosyltransferase involved in cell wall biosynthesis